MEAFRLRNKKKIFNDPVYGFIDIPDKLHFDIIESSCFQRLRRIKQAGLSHLVYPGALHTRFQHCLGAMYLMRHAVRILQSKGYEITKDETQAASLAILLHDIGHGPFSHTLEKTLVHDISHEEISLLLMHELNQNLDGQLEEAIAVFKGTHLKRFLSKLVSSQLDVDRLDYLKRDSFFTGVVEGSINAERLISMIEVVDNELAIEAKGIYSVEHFIVARSLMYWQVYLHKTVLSAESMLTKALERAQEISRRRKLFATPALSYFLEHIIDVTAFKNDASVLEKFCRLDDFDIFTSLKVWINDEDPILSYLSNSIVNRHLFRIELQDASFSEEKIALLHQRAQKCWNLRTDETNYFVVEGHTSNHAYHPKQAKINIIYKDGSIKDISEASDQLNISVLSQPVTKYFVCYPKELM
jgi:HD superfamily phosphohydrolase